MPTLQATRPAVTTLGDVYTSFLAAEHGNPTKAAAGLKNRDRSPTDLKTHERALRYVAVAATGGVDSLELCPADALDVGPALLERRVHDGAGLLAAREGKEVPSLKTLQNAVSCCKAVRRAVFGESVHRSVQQRVKALPKRKTRPRFSYDAWPEELAREWEAYATWKAEPYLPEAEKPYRKKICRPTTMEDNRTQVNAYVGYLVREGGGDRLTLLDLATPDTFRAFLNAYFAQDADGGYKACNNLATQMAQVSLYLVAKGRLPEKNELGRTPASVFYGIGREILQDAAERGEIRPAQDIGSWTPDVMFELAGQAWDTPPPGTSRPGGKRYERQRFNRYRTALFFFMAYDTPLRHRNWIEMRWGKNLKRNALGLWEVHFEGRELKVGRRAYATNVYDQTYSAPVSRKIDAWRAIVEARFGPGFEENYPYVFTSFDLEGNLPENQLAKNTFHYHVRHLVMELRGEPFNPHKVRHIVASYLVNEFGPQGMGLAAELLGDTINVVMSTYYRPNNEAALKRYQKQ